MILKLWKLKTSDFLRKGLAWTDRPLLIYRIIVGAFWGSKIEYCCNKDQVEFYCQFCIPKLSGPRSRDTDFNLPLMGATWLAFYVCMPFPHRKSPT